MNFGKLFAVALTVLMAAGHSMADEATVKAQLLKKYSALSPAIVVKKLDVGGLYEVNLLGQEAYTNEKVEYLLIGGSLVDAATLVDLTAKRKPGFLRDFVKALPLEHAIKLVYGKGERTLVSFEDPDCPRCREQHIDWVKNPEKFNATVYAFMFPLNIHPDAKRKAEYLWCQENPAKAWTEWMSSGKGIPVDGKGVLVSTYKSCAAGIDHVAASEKLARSLEYHSTPRFIFENGAGADTVLSVADFESAFGVVSKKMDEIKALDAAEALAKQGAKPSKK
jgi:thiol:disulfide interchange protein DsbC